MITFPCQSVHRLLWLGSSLLGEGSALELRLLRERAPLDPRLGLRVLAATVASCRPGCRNVGGIVHENLRTKTGTPWAQPFDRSAHGTHVEVLPEPDLAVENAG